jgi:cytochrome P450
MTGFPPGPTSSFPGRLFLQFRKDPMGFLEHAASQFGDVVHWRMGYKHVFFLNDPELIRDVLVRDDKSFDKQMEASQSLLGQGLTTSNGELHRRQRQTIQPSFRRDQIAEFAEVMVERAVRAQSGWEDGATVDIKPEMERIALGVVGETLFGTNLDPQAAAIGRAMIAALGAPPNMMVPVAKWVELLPLPMVRRAKAGRALIHAVVDQIIRERRSSAIQRDDLLSMLLSATNHHDGDGGVRMSEQQLHDELMNLLIGGYETVSDAMSWIWYLLSQHPEVERCLHQELDCVLRDQLPVFPDFTALQFTQNVVRELLRLYPPLWIIWRKSREDYPLNGWVAPSGSLVLICQYVTHRDQRYFPEPLRFKPERWTEEFRERLPKFAYFPFGGGARQCIGDRFGFMEAVLVTATIAQKWKFRLVPGHPVVPHALLTLRPKYGLPMTAHRRNR